MKVIAGLLLSCLCGVVFANAQSNALKACDTYQAAIKKMNPKEYLPDCKINQRSAEQWQCMLDRQVNQKWNFSQASTACFKKAPALAFFKKKYQTILANTNPSTVCYKAMAVFLKYDPNNKNLKMLEPLCKTPERTAIEWQCMKSFAEGQNSFNFSSTQCFP